MSTSSSSATNLNCKSNVAGITNIIVGTGDIVPEVPNFILKIIPSSLQYPSYVIYEVAGEELDRLGDGFVYTVQSNLRIDCDVEDIGNFTDYYRNFRIGVFNQELPDGVNIGNYVFDKSQIWSSLLSTFNNWEDKTVEFTFNKDYPLYIIITSEFITAQPTDFSLSYTPPAIIESSVYTKYETPGNYPVPILKTLQSDTYSEITVNTFEKSTPIVFYDFPFEEEFGTDSKYAVRGIQFDCDVECDSRVVGLLKLKHPQGETGEKSIILENNETNHITLGGNFDTWGFKISQLNNIKDWEFELELQNLFSNENNTSEVQLKNVQVTAYYIEIPSDKTYCIIDGEDARYYGIFLDEPDIPFGVKTDTKYHDLDGIDMNDAYRMNITKKEIKLKFNLFGCNFDETTQQLKEIAKLLTNKRDKLNRPIPKTIEFSHLPGEHFDYIMPDPIDPKMNASDYDPEVKLVIPDGTSWANEDTVTSNIGSNDGIAKVSPIISLIPLSQTVDITELNSNQKFSITYSGFNSDKIVEINCNTQQVLLKSNEGDSNPINITDYADFGVDWFKLEVGEYVFDAGSSAIIQSVTITQRG